MEQQFFNEKAVYVGEVNIKVTSLEQSIPFYKDILGFRMLEQTKDKVVLTADGKTPLVTLEQPEGIQPKQGRTAGLYHFALLLPARADLSSFLTHILQSKYRFGLGAADHYVSEALYLSDPDGNGIEVYHDRPSSGWNWSNGQVDMATVELDAKGLLAETSQKWTGLPRETIMGHIHLHVTDLKSTKAFYVKGLGFDIVTSLPGALFTSTASYHHHIGLNVWNGTGAKIPDKNQVGLNWFTLIFPNNNKRNETVIHLQKQGIKVEKEGEANIIEDPSGNVIRLMIR
ncbi:catechol 2,3-dioxygenase [Salinibacillus kushneri]|uniref:Catechol 2,3-dioxygenase n=1 Tax=Salinibacillus kushneri TaxID=237682 RepID=A0A1I0IHA7_9BACI|nr:VOC family protein [Salinibacillus kushneri]SET96043.1 catechol 2,3-dioxygenase [Salinibacillus kushneri]